MRNILSFLLFTMMLGFCNGQSSLLEKYPFSNGGYVLLATRCTTNDSLANTLGDFYIEDSLTLEEIKEEWINTKTQLQDENNRNWTYLVYVCKNKTSIDDGFEIGLKEYYILPLYGWRFCFFNVDQFLKHADKFIKAFKRSEKFSSLKEARIYYNNINKDDKLIYSPVPHWISYEGSFSFSYVCNNGDCTFQGSKVLDSLKEQIQKTYPGEAFLLESTGGSSSVVDGGTFTINCNIYCNRLFAKKFKLYQMDTMYNDFTDFDLITYWKE